MCTTTATPRLSNSTVDALGGRNIFLLAHHLFCFSITIDVQMRQNVAKGTPTAQYYNSNKID